MTLLIGWPMKCVGRRLAEQRLVHDSKAPKLPEPVARRGGGHRCRIQFCLPQRPPRQSHTAQQEIALWRYSQMLLAARAQCALRNADRLADFRDVERVSRVFLHHTVEAAHDGRVLALRQSGLAVVAIVQATDD